MPGATCLAQGGHRASSINPQGHFMLLPVTEAPKWWLNQISLSASQLLAVGSHHPVSLQACPRETTHLTERGFPPRVGTRKMFFSMSASLQVPSRGGQGKGRFPPVAEVLLPWQWPDHKGTGAP